jgi:CheY-like chemotaxis protein
VTTILVVEDNIHLNEVYTTILRFKGFAVIQAASCREAIEQLQTVTPKVILLDLSLPDGSGLSVADYVRNKTQFQETRIVVASGSQHQSQLKAAGIEHFLYKPVSIPALLDCIKHLV